MSSGTTIKLKSGSELPSHVPLHLVREVSGFLVPNKLSDPYSPSLEVFETYPRIFFTPEFVPSLYDGAWVVTHYEDIREVYQNDELYSTADAAGFQRLVGETFRMIPLAVDPPEHGKYRILLNPWFSPKAITELEPKIKATINGLIDQFATGGACDVAYDYGRIYPVRVFMDLMGFPPERLEEFLAWEYAILHAYGDVERMKWGIGSAIRYLRSFIEEMRRAPADNLTSHIVHGQVDGRPLTEDEIIGTVSFLWLGGLDTVAATTALMFRRLALDPGLQDRLRTSPELIPDAIEEFLRVQPLVNSTRLVKKDHEVHGVKVKRGDHIMCYNATGNFDPSEFESPREFRLDRSSNRHFTLAGGPHRCLGSHLARRELRLALGEFLRRIPSFQMKPGADLTAHPGLMAVPRLPLVWDADKAHAAQR
ncbi:MAG: cytochrome P450 [Caulobacteraceae bacterium]|nr:cytochrome P450 [Caulobacteraceae bacterium]